MAHFLRMVGLPYQLSASATKRWFKENGVVGAMEVHLILNRDSRPSGMGFASFEEERDAETALDLDGQCIGDSTRYVKFIRTDHAECKWYLDRQERHLNSKDKATPLHLVRLRGVPFKVNEYEIARWFRKGTSTECVDVQCGSSRNTHGLANAYFQTAEEASRAMKMDKEDMEGRYIELAMDKVRVTFDKDAGAGDLSLRMTGVPYRTTDAELKDFFQPAAKCVDVKVVLNRDGMPSGEAIATFESEEEVKAAMTCDKTYMGSRYVVLQRTGDNNSFPSSAPPPSHHDRTPHRGGRGGGGPRGGGIGGRNDGGSGGNNVRLHGLPYDATETDIVEFFKSVAACTNVRILQNRNGMASGDAIASFGSKEDAEAALSRNREYIGSRYVTLSLYN